MGENADEKQEETPEPKYGSRTQVLEVLQFSLFLFCTSIVVQVVQLINFVA